jgi:hypothetical protein
MKNKRYLIGILLFVALNHILDWGPFNLLVPVYAQATTVTGQVKDVNGVPYAGARFTLDLVNANGFTLTAPATITQASNAICQAAGLGPAPCQQPFPMNLGPFTLDAGGNVPGGGITAQDNTLVTPAGTLWVLTALSLGNPPPLGTGPQACTATITISGGSQSISTNFAACPALSSGGASSPSPGGPQVFKGIDYATWSAKTIYGCAWTSGQATITGCPAGTFTSANVIPAVTLAWASNATSGSPSVNPATIITCPQTTIASMQSSTAVTLTATCTATSGVNNLFVFGPDETTGFINFMNAVANACGTGIFPAGKIITQAPPQLTPPTVNCVSADPQQRLGPTLIGQGVGNSQILPSPNFDFTKCTNGGASTSCFFGAAGPGSPSGENCMNLSIFGSGNGNPTSATAHNLVEINNGAYYYNCSFLSWAGATSNLTGAFFNGTPQSIIGVQVDGFGFLNCNVSGATTGVTLSQMFCGDSNGSSLQVGGGIVQSNQNIWGNSYGSNVNVTLVNVGGILVSNGDIFSGGINAGNTDTTLSVTGGSSNVHITNGTIYCGAANFTCLFIGTSGNNVHLQGTKIGSGATGHTLNLVAGANLFDDGGNTFAAGSGNTLSGNVFGSSSITGTALVAGNVVPSAGWGTTATVTAPAGDSHLFTFTVNSAGTGQAASPTLAVTFPTPYITAPGCSAIQIGGTGAIADLTTTTGPSTTTVTFTWNATPAAGLTYIIQGRCQ